MYLSSNSIMHSNHIRRSAWLEHAPFAFWLMDILQPKNVVELGTHNGFSFLSMCQAAKSMTSSTTIYAVDTWQGDEHAGFYSPEIYDTLEAEVRTQYPGIGVLIRSTFAEARSQFAAGSVDLLHIDGRHRYEDVVEDFETWKSSLSDCGVVLFHDTRVQRGDFGVWKFWKELEKLYPTFEFFHGSGLGVLLFGKYVSPILSELCEAQSVNKQLTRDVYARLGAINSISYQLGLANSQIHSVIKDCHLTPEQIACFEANQSELGSIVRKTFENEKKSIFEKFEKEKRKIIENFELQIMDNNKNYESKIFNLQTEINSSSLNKIKALEGLEAERKKNESILASRSWKLTAPYRYIGYLGRRVVHVLRRW